MKQIINKVILGAILTFGFSLSSWAIPVDLELVLLNDVSGNVSNSDYGLVKAGYRDAFQNSGVQLAITSGAIKSIAATYIEWSGPDQQEVSVGWTLIDDVADANAFGAAIFDAPRAFANLVDRSALGSALNFAVSTAGGAGDKNINHFEGTRSVIDVSGNGIADEGADTSMARDAALDDAGAGIDAINGLVIGRDPSVLEFYEKNAIGGTDSPFVTVAASFDDFASALNSKLIREIASDPSVPVPEPSTFALLVLGVSGLGFFRKRKNG